MNVLAYNYLNTFIEFLYNYLDKNYSELIDFCYKLDNFEELKDAFKNISIELNYEYDLLLYAFDGEVPTHPFFKTRIEVLGLQCIKNSLIKSREFLKKEVTFEDLYNLIKYKNKTISFLRDRLQMTKVPSSGLIEPLIDSKPTLNINTSFSSTPKEKLESPKTSPRSLLPGTPQNIFEYNPFVNNVWK